MPWKRLDLAGKYFGRLLVIKECKESTWKKVLWECKCTCGKKVVIPTRALRSGRTSSCGCLRSEKFIKRITKHGCYGTVIYNAYMGAKGRCLNPLDKAYKNYGGRGIKFKFESFKDFEDAVRPLFEEGKRLNPNMRLSLDRIDVNGDYEKGNLRYTTYKEQARNMRSNNKITFNGKTLCIKAWAETFGINYNTLKWRLSNGWSIEDSLR